MDLVILCALELEASPIIKSLQLHEKTDIFDKRLRLRFFTSIKEAKICLLLFGKCPTHKVDRIGTQIASLATWEAIRVLRPKLLASVGTAGGFRAKGAKIGDVYISDGYIYFHGRHVPISKYNAFEIGGYPTSSLKIPKSIKMGVISSGDSIPVSEDDRIKMMRINTDAKDMEAAAVAEVAHLAAVPMFALKAISDFVDSNELTHTQFLANYRSATENLNEALRQIISHNCIG